MLNLRLVAVAASLFIAGCSEPHSPKPIDSKTGEAPAFIGSSATAKPIDFHMPAHPYMADQGFNAMHSDGYNSDVHPAGGPLGRNPQLNTRVGSSLPGGQCATLTFDSEQRLVALCAAISGFRIHLLAPRSLELLAEYKLPIRPSSYDALIHRDKSKIMEDSSGAYFYLDNHDRVVMAASDQTIRRFGHRQSDDGHWEFYEDNRWDLSPQVPHDCTTLTNWNPAGECDPITAVMPDHLGYIWWVTRQGRLGTLDPETGKVQTSRIGKEEIQNGFAVAADGVYIVSDHAMYRFYAGDNGEVKQGWREVYDRGSARKVGTINQGSGTTPTLMGEEYVTITDNADGRMNLVVYQRQQDYQGQRQICAIPIFEENHSVTDNSMVAFGHSIVIENNAGYRNVFQQQDWDNAGGGIVRVDVRADNSGCDIVWTSTEHSPSVVPKLSAGNGLAYFYSFTPLENGENAWYLTALDFASGKTRFKILTGIGSNFDNNWAPLTLAPDGTAYVGTAKGLVAIWDKD